MECPLASSLDGIEHCISRLFVGLRNWWSTYRTMDWNISAWTCLNLRVKFFWKCRIMALYQQFSFAISWHRNESLIVQDVPDVLTLRQKLSGKGKVPCLLCGQAEIVLKDMWKQVGGHILHDQCDCAASNECGLWEIGNNLCGFCGLHGCLTQILKKKDGGFITSTCAYHYVQMQYWSAAQFSKCSPLVH